MTLVVRRTALVADRLAVLGCQGGRLLERLLGGRPADQRLLRADGVHAGRVDRAQRDAGGGDVRAVQPQRDAGGRRGPVAGAALDLLVRAPTALAHGDAHLDEHLGVADGRLVGALMELVHVEHALAGAPAYDRGRAERRAHGAEILGGVRLAEGPADRAAVADGRVGDHLLGL